VANIVREKKIPQLFSVLETSMSKGMVSMDHSLAKLVAE
jgi:Tfp pilus assembly pilus retraction ATPase PilT